MRAVFNSMSKTFVLSLGGSLISTGAGIDGRFLKEFKAFILTRVKLGDRFFLVVGGGAVCRLYQRAVKPLSKVSQADLDWIGISATRLNAQLIKTIFGSLVHPDIIIDPTKTVRTKKPLVLVAGYQPGWSTDYEAVLVAKKHGARTVVNLSNIDYAYDKDPKKYASARKLEKLSWPEFRKIVGYTWKPGSNTPFDPIASREAAESGLQVVILNGRKLGNLKSFFDGKRFKGTTIDG